MTELSFLIELLLNHELPKETKQLIAERIKEVEQKMTKSWTDLLPSPESNPFNKPLRIPLPNGPQQAPSTLAAMARHGGDQTQFTPPPPAPEPMPLTGVELQARENSVEILKRKKQNFSNKH